MEPFCCVRAVVSTEILKHSFEVWVKIERMRMLPKLPSQRSLLIIALLLFTVLVALPFHGFLSVVAGEFSGVPQIVKVWKEGLLVIAACVVAFDMYRQPHARKKFISSRLHQFVAIYGLLHVVLWLVFQPPLGAVLVSLTLNLRFLGIFLIGRWLMQRTADKTLAQSIANAVTASLVAAVVAAFVKEEIVSTSQLEAVGYNGDDALQARYTLDDNPNRVRYAGTTRGPNVLGLLAGMLSTILAGSVLPKIVRKSTKKDALFTVQVLIIVLASVVVLLTYSRSAALATVIAISIVVFMSLPAQFKKVAASVVVLSVLVGGFLIIGALDSSATLRTLILHDDPSSGGAITSTSRRFEANKVAFEDIVRRPLGDGPGTAGPASFYNDEETRIAENYYLQLGQGVGLIGLFLFVVIVSIVGRNLYLQRRKYWPRILFATLVGISVAGMFTHVWTDGEVALIWWGLAGLFIED